MSKTNVKRPKFCGRADRFWRNKVRLYLVLHGKVGFADWSPCSICSQGIGIYGGHQCRMVIKGQPRWMINRDFSKIDKEPGKDASYSCIEWIKNV